MDNQHWIVNYRAECMVVARRYTHVRLSPCRRRHHVGKEYRARKGRELRTEPYSIPALEVRQKKTGTLRIKRKKVGMNVVIHVKRRN